MTVVWPTPSRSSWRCRPAWRPAGASSSRWGSLLVPTSRSGTVTSVQTTSSTVSQMVMHDDTPCGEQLTRRTCLFRAYHSEIMRLTDHPRQDSDILVWNSSINYNHCSVEFSAHFGCSSFVSVGIKQRQFDVSHLAPRPSLPAKFCLRSRQFVCKFIGNSYRREN